MKKEVSHSIEAIIIKVLTGNLNDRERIEFENWLNSDSESHAIFNKYKKAWELSGKYSHNDSKNWEKINNKIDSGYHVPNYITTPGKVRSFKLYATWQKIAAVALILLITAFFTKIFFDKYTDIKLVSHHGTSSKILPDGSEIVLNKGSEITYSKAFNRKTRELNLYGEAFFKVSPNKEKAFIIECSNTIIKVVGTEFNVNTDSTLNEVILSVIEGIVEFFPSGSYDKKVTLVKGEEGRINFETGAIKKSTIKNPNFIAWKTHELYFEETPLADAISSIRNLYNTVIVAADSTVQTVKITSTFKNQDLRKVLEEIHILTGINYSFKNDTIFLR